MTVCEKYGHDIRWRLVVGPMREDERRGAVLLCLDCKKIMTEEA